MRRVGFLGHPDRPAVRRAASRLATLLKRRGIAVRFDSQLAREMQQTGQPLASLARWAQLLVTLGGDGTALRGACAAARGRAQVLSINLGGLGFLAAAEGAEAEDALRAALAGEWPAVRHRLIETRVTRKGRVVLRGQAVNDVVIKAAGGYSAVHLRVEALGADLGHLLADGLIVASAAGSTAYSLSAGGPVVSRDLDVMIATPVCPHTLASRPLVLGSEHRLDVRVLGSFDRPALFFDGQEPGFLERGDRIELRLSRATTRILENPGRSLGRALRAKLGWQGSERRSFR